MHRQKGQSDANFFSFAKRTDLQHSIGFLLSVGAGVVEAEASDLLGRVNAELERRPKLKQSTKKLRDEWRLILNRWRCSFTWTPSEETKAA